MKRQGSKHSNEPLKQKVERAIGDEFVSWLNKGNCSQFQFERVGADPPDLIYRDGNKTLAIEITTAYYDQEDASMLWRLAREDRTTPVKRSKPFDEPDQRLIGDINKRIIAKCLGAHEAGTVLVIDVYPAITRTDEFETLRHKIAIPGAIPFGAIYVTGWFPSGGDGRGGYSCWKVS